MYNYCIMHFIYKYIPNTNYCLVNGRDLPGGLQHSWIWFNCRCIRDLKTSNEKSTVIADVFEIWRHLMKTSTVIADVLEIWRHLMKTSTVIADVFQIWRHLMKISTVIVDVFQIWRHLMKISIVIADVFEIEDI